MATSDTDRAAVVVLASEIAVTAAELYAAFLNVRIPDTPGRGDHTFSGQQAFELTKTLLGHVAEETLG